MVLFTSKEIFPNPLKIARLPYHETIARLVLLDWRSLYFNTHCGGQGNAVTVTLSQSVAVVFDQVDVKVDGAVENSHQMRELGDTLNERGKLNIQL